MVSEVKAIHVTTVLPVWSQYCIMHHMWVLYPEKCKGHQWKHGRTTTMLKTTNREKLDSELSVCHKFCIISIFASVWHHNFVHLFYIFTYLAYT